MPVNPTTTDPLDEPYRCNVGGVSDRVEFREMLSGLIDDAEVTAADMIAEMGEAITALTKRSATIADPHTTMPAGWLLATLKLLHEMAGEGISITDCEEPDSLMSEIAEHLGVGDADDPWDAAVKEMARHV